MSRHTDVVTTPTHTPSPPLPVIDWKRINYQAPQIVPVNYEGANAPLPKADVVVITWTVAEWSAFDHVFINSDEPRPFYSKQYRKEWNLYSRAAPTTNFSTLWGYYRMVSIQQLNGQKLDVLLYKSDSHLAHPPWIDGLSDMVKCIVEDTGAKCIYSIGTAGGSTNDESLGDAVITTSAHIRLKKPENTHVDYNNQTFSCPNYYPGTKLLQPVQDQLFYPMSNVVTNNELEYLFYLLQKAIPNPGVELADLITQPLDPTSLHNPKVIASKKPLLTTDFYFIATGDNAASYSFLEMDDAVIAHEAGALGVDYVFIRNISDPLVADKTKTGNPIDSKVREEWSSLIYENFGIYTSINSALATWATLAGK